MSQPLAATLAQRLGPLDGVLVVVDFDGTLAPIVDDPADARPLPASVELLAQLVDRAAGVLVVSGRPVAYLAEHLPATLDLVGLYGLEGIAGGRRWEHPSGGVWREVVADVAGTAAQAVPSGVRVEHKDLSITLHYRGVPEAADEVRALAERLAARSGLHVRPARRAVELHPPVEADKGRVVEERVGDAAAVLMVGDDVADLAAFDAVGRMVAGGRRGLCVAVRSAEAPAELLAGADLTVDGPAGVEELLAALLGEGAG